MVKNDLVTSRIKIDLPDDVDGWRKKATFERTCEYDSDKLMLVWDLLDDVLGFALADDKYEIKIEYDGETI